MSPITNHRIGTSPGEEESVLNGQDNQQLNNTHGVTIIHKPSSCMEIKLSDGALIKFSSRIKPLPSLGFHSAHKDLKKYS